MAEEKKFLATLVRGNCYYLGNKRFENGKPVEVTIEERDHLEENAVDRFNAGGESFEKPKFEFEEAADGESTSKSTRSRSRK
tara:strand:- start:269 stop:514 length:246 start_codon:yes stop_codon:yes gene_type:complete